MTICRYNLSDRFMCTTNKKLYPYSGSSAIYTIANTAHESVTYMSSIGWKGGTFPGKLGNVDRRSVGITNRGWLPTRTGRDPMPNQLPPSYDGLQRGTSSNNHRGGWIISQRGDPGNTTNSREFCLSDFPGGKEGWGPETSSKPEMLKSVHEGRAFQDGRTPSPSRSYPSRRLDGQVGPEGCISPGPHSPRSSKIPGVWLEQQILPVQMPAFRVVYSSPGLHQTTKTSSWFSETDRMPPDNLLRRHPISTSGQGSAVQNLTVSLPAVSVPGIVNQRQKVLVNSTPTNGFFRLPPVLPNITDICTIRKDEENSTKCHQNANTGPGYHQRNGQVCRESSGNSPCFSLGSSALQSPTIHDECSSPSPIPAGESSVLVQHKSATGRTEQGRFEMVDTAGQKDNRITNPATTTLDANRVRCINQGMGCSTEHSDTNRGCVVSTGSHQSHQLLRAIGGIPSTQILWQDLESYDSPASVGQFYSSDLHQSERGHLLPETVSASHLSVGMVPRQEHHTVSRAPPRDSQCSSGCGIENGERSLRLDAKPSCVSEDHDSDGSTRDRPVCLQVNQTTSALLQLEARPRGRGHGCLPPGLGKGTRFCQPTLVPHTPVLNQGQDRGGEDGPSGSLVENAIMVPGITGATGGLSKSSPTSTRSSSDAIRSGFSNATRSPNTDRLFHLRESFTSQGFSPEASDLMLASWRPKTNTNYGSCFARWADWCKQRDRDPLKGPISDIVNFLAELFSKGYQYQSLNAYRSAIASAHERIDGMSIGQHPAITRVLKGAYQSRPPLPRYSSFWDVGVVIEYLKTLGPNESLSLRMLTLKTTMLMALTRPSRAADLCSLDIQARSYVTNGVIFRATHLSKQSRASKPLADFFFPAFQEDVNVCPVSTLRVYEDRTLQFRNDGTGEMKSKLFLSWIGKHSPVSSSTIARWLKTCMLGAGIDINAFKPHSVRGATCSKAAGVGVTTKDILDAADWSSEGTFQRFYHRQDKDITAFGMAVLSSSDSSKTTC